MSRNLEEVAERKRDVPRRPPRSVPLIVATVSRIDPCDVDRRAAQRFHESLGGDLHPGERRRLRPDDEEPPQQKLRMLEPMWLPVSGTERESSARSASDPHS